MKVWTFALFICGTLIGNVLGSETDSPVEIKAKVVDSQVYSGAMPFMTWGTPDRPPLCSKAGDDVDKPGVPKMKGFQAKIPSYLVGADHEKYCGKCLEIICGPRKAYAKIVDTFPSQSPNLQVSPDVFMSAAESTANSPAPITWKIVECQGDMFLPNKKYV